MTVPRSRLLRSLAKVAAPATLVGCDPGDRVLGVERDAFDVEAVVVYDVRKLAG